MDAAADLSDFERAERYARALEDYTRPEPLPWAVFFSAKARALAAHRQGDRSEAHSRELERLADEASRLGPVFARQAVESVRHG